MSYELVEVMAGVREYAEDRPVVLWREENGRLVVRAENEGGHNVTHVDLLDILNWVTVCRPDLLPQDARLTAIEDCANVADLYALTVQSDSAETRRLAQSTARHLAKRIRALHSPIAAPAVRSPEGA